MKLSAFIAILMAGATSLFAINNSPVENDRCRELAEVSNFISAAHDLVNGIWLAEAETTYEFSENGSLTVFSKNKNGIIVADLLTWKVDMLEGGAVLFISDNSSDEIFHMEQTCEGIDLVNFVNHDMVSLKHVAALPGHANEVEKNLPGEWTNVTFIESKNNCDHAQGAYLNYSFGENGQYRIDYGSRTAQELEMGKWSVSKDGQFLLLTNTLGNISVIRIAQVDSHGLILEQVMKTNEIGEYFCSEQTSFAFIK